MVRRSKPQVALVPQDLRPGDKADRPPLRDVLTQIACFLKDLGYSKALEALDDEALKNGVEITMAEWRGQGSQERLGLMHFWNGARLDSGMKPGLGKDDSEDSGDDDDSESGSDEAEGGAPVEREAEVTSDDSSDEESDSESSAKAGQKRKRVMTPSSSGSGSSTSDSESGQDQAKKATAASNSSDSSSDSDSSSEDGDRRPAKRAKVSDGGDSSSDSGSESSSEDDASGGAKRSVSSKSSSGSSESESESSSEDDSSSSSESESSAPPPKKTHTSTTKKPIRKPSLSTQPSNARTGSATSSSETLGADSPVINTTNGDMHPDRAQRVPASTRTSSNSNSNNNNSNPKKDIARERKGEQTPFSRIPADTKVDPRFASNSYVPYDYAERAYKDLSVTKGRGFTKEKNKKKRGAYRGGPIDLQPKGIKFDD